MNDPPRWTDPDGDAPEGMPEVLKYARPSKPMGAAVKARSVAHVVKLAATPTVAAAVVWKGVWAKVLVSALALSVAGAVVVRRASAPGARAVTAAPSSIPRAERPRPAPPVVTPAPSPARPPEASTPSVAPAPAPAPAPTPTPSPAVGRALARGHRPPSALPVAARDHEEDPLLRESASLGGVASVIERDPTEALRRLGAHRAEFPHGQLGDERDFLAFEGHRRLGHASVARALGEAFLREHPGSLHASTVRQRLTEAP